MLGKVRFYFGMVKTPFIPRLHALLEYFEMFGIRHDPSASGELGDCYGQDYTDFSVSERAERKRGQESGFVRVISTERAHILRERVVTYLRVRVVFTLSAPQPLNPVK